MEKNVRIWDYIDMDRKRNKKWIGIVSVALICICIVIMGNHLSKSSEAVLVASDGKTVIAHLYWKDKKIQYECPEGCEDDIDLTCREAIEVLRKKDGLSKEEAGKKLVKEQYTLITYFEEDAFKALEKGDKAITSSSGEALALSDGKGHLLAAYTSGNNSSVNQLLKKTYAGSTMKPLSTYGLGIEKNVISWSSLYKDSAYEENWPTNVEAFTEQEETVTEALAESNNAITVKVLDDVGIKEACTFMRDSLELQVDEEKKMIDEDTELIHVRHVKQQKKRSSLKHIR